MPGGTFLTTNPLGISSNTISSRYFKYLNIYLFSRHYYLKFSRQYYLKLENKLQQANARTVVFHLKYKFVAKWYRHQDVVVLHPMLNGSNITYGRFAEKFKVGSPHLTVSVRINYVSIVFNKFEHY